MLVVARESRQMTQSELATKAQIPQGVISKAEHGLTELTNERLSTIAEVLGYPVELFGWDEEVYGFGSAAFYHRKQKSLSQQHLKKIHADFNLTRIRVKRLTQGLDIHGKHQFSPLDLDDFDSSRHVAQAARAMWQLPMGPVRNMVRVVENAEGIVVFEDFGTDKISAISQWAPGERPIFVLNSVHSPDRQRFTLAHEVAHILMHATPRETQEQEADEFASEFLMPAAEISPDLARGIDLARAAQLKTVWRVSMGALIRRARDLGYITDSRYTSLSVQMSQKGWRKREPVEITADEPRFVSSVIKAKQEDGYDVDDLSAVAGLYPAEFSDKFLPTPSTARRLRVIKP